MARRRNMRGNRIGYNGRTSGPRHLKRKVSINASGGHHTDWQNYQSNPQMMAFIRQNGWGNMPMGWILCKLCETFGPNDCSGWCDDGGSSTRGGGNGRRPKIRSNVSMRNKRMGIPGTFAGYNTSGQGTCWCNTTWSDSGGGSALPECCPGGLAYK